MAQPAVHQHITRPRRRSRACGGVLRIVLSLLVTAAIGGRTSGAAEPTLPIAENQCESKGIEQLIEFTRSRPFEVMHVFIPAGTSASACQWIEIGQSASGSGTEEAIIRPDRDYLRSLMRRYHRVHIYHSHPLIYFEKCADSTPCGAFSVPMTTDSVSTQGLVSNLRYAMPSPIDIAFMMDVSREFDQYRHHEGEIRHRVVTPYGIVEYSLTEKGKEALKNTGMEWAQGRYGFDTYIKARVSYALLDIEDLIKGDQKDIQEVLHEVARRMSNEYLHVRYLPF